MQKPPETCQRMPKVKSCRNLIASVPCAMALPAPALSMRPETEQATASIDAMPSAVDPAASAPAIGQHVNLYINYNDTKSV